MVLHLVGRYHEPADNMEWYYYFQSVVTLYFVLSELVMAALVDLQLHIQVTFIVEWGSNTWDAGLEVHAN